MTTNKIAKHNHSARLTPKSHTAPISVPVDKKKIRREENEEYLKNENVKAFLAMTGKSEGGDYHAKFGWLKNKPDWVFTDESTHPGAGNGGKTTAAGLYQINNACWTEHGIKSQGLSDFSPHTQDMISVDNLRAYHSIQFIIDGDIKSAINKLKENQWTSFKTHKYEVLEGWYEEAGGKVK
ncbi:muramidase (phage lysozyme) [Oxalobacteraceae bacterium GrIS 1.11]